MISSENQKHFKDQSFRLNSSSMCV